MFLKTIGLFLNIYNINCLYLIYIFIEVQKNGNRNYHLLLNRMFRYLFYDWNSLVHSNEFKGSSTL